MPQEKKTSSETSADVSERGQVHTKGDLVEAVALQIFRHSVETEVIPQMRADMQKLFDRVMKPQVQ